MVEALTLAVGWGGASGDLATDAVHAEGHVLIAPGDIVGQDAVDPDVTVGGSHLDHSSAPAHILGESKKAVIPGSRPLGHSLAPVPAPEPKTWTSSKLCSDDPATTMRQIKMMVANILQVPTTCLGLREHIQSSYNAID